MTGKAFLQHLLRKLKTGNARSVHLNALPGRYARLDLYDLINIQPSLQLKFIRALLNQSVFKLEIHIDFKRFGDDEEAIQIARAIAKKLDAMYYQERDDLMEYGIQTFGFGYPLLIKVEEERVLKAPLLIWPLELQKDLHRQFTWTISRKNDHPPVFNELLRSHIEKEDGIQTDDLLSLLEDDHLSESALSDFVHQLLHKLGVDSSEQDIEIKVLPATNKETIEKHSIARSWIRWSGVFGSYKSQKQSIIRDIETLLEDKVSGVEHVEHSITAEDVMSIVATDPSQDNILYRLRQTDHQVIQGPPGTGKSQVLTALISDRLYHGKPCLVVCEKKTALEVIYNHLKDAGLEELCVVIDDIHSDRKQVVERVRALLESRQEDSRAFRSIEMAELIEDRRELKAKIDSYLRVLNERSFGDDNLHDLISRFHKEQHALSEGTLSLIELGPYSYDAFRKLVTIVDAGSKLYARIDQPMSLDQVSDSYFLTPDKLNGLKKVISELINKIEHWLKDHHRAVELHGKLYEEQHEPVKLKYLSWIWKPFKKARQARTAALEDYNMLNADWRAAAITQAIQLCDSPGSTYEAMASDLEAARSLLLAIRKEENAFSEYQSWRKFLIDQKPSVQKTLLKLAALLKSNQWPVVFKLSYWNAFIQQQTASAPSASLEQLLVNYSWLDEEVRQRLPSAILHNWDNRQKAVLQQRTILETKHLYNFRRNKKYGRRNSLRKMIHQDIELFRSTFPVLMVNPTVCASILPLVEESFECVLLDEASQLRIEDTYTALLRGRKKIVSGDRHQMPPSDHFASEVVLSEQMEDDDVSSQATDEFLAASSSLLEFGMDTDYESAYLDFHYRSRHPDLIAFSNAAFYGQRLVPMPPQNQDSAISFHAIDGLYLKNRTNPEEAKAIATYVLSEIQPIKDTYPSIGIATFNINQRNLIWDELMALAHADEAMAKRLSMLIHQGLFVKNLEHVQGDERDIILISTTFGPDENGDFRQSFGPLSQEKGYKLLNVIITRAKQEMVIFTSIPNSNIDSYLSALETQGNTGKAILYAFLQYASFVASGQREAARELLEQVALRCHESRFQHETGQMPLLHQQLYSALQAHYGTAHIKHNQSFGGFMLHIAYVKGDQIKAAIQTSLMPMVNETSCKKLLYRQKMLAEHRVKLITVDAMDWHRDPEAVLAALIRQIDATI